MSWKLRRAKTYRLSHKFKKRLNKYLLVGLIICLTGYWITEIFPLFGIVWLLNWGLFPLMLCLRIAAW